MHAGLAVILVSLFLVPSAYAAEASIVGVWYEEVTYGGSRVISVLDVKADGTYTGVYRRCLAEGPSDSISRGHWTYKNGMWRTTEESGYWPVVDEYQTESNDGRVWVYRSVAGNGFMKYGAVRFRDVRVGPDSKLPTCDAIS